MNTKALTYGELADLLNKYDEDDIPIYVLVGKTKVAIDNFILFREVTGFHQEDISPFTIICEDDSMVIKSVTD